MEVIKFFGVIAASGVIPKQLQNLDFRRRQSTVICRS